LILPGYTYGMKEDKGSVLDRESPPDGEAFGAEHSEDTGHPAIERICEVGFGVLAVGICLQAVAAAIALAVVLGMIVLGVTGGSGPWAITIAVTVIIGICGAGIACRIRNRRAGTQA